MASTNKTKFLKLSQFIDTDKPTWLGDVNNDMNLIDAGVEKISNDVTSAQSQAEIAKSSADNALSVGTEAGEKATSNETEINDLKIRVTNVEAKSTNNETNIAGINNKVCGYNKVFQDNTKYKLLQTNASTYTTLGNSFNITTTGKPIVFVTKGFIILPGSSTVHFNIFVDDENKGEILNSISATRQSAPAPGLESSGFSTRQINNEDPILTSETTGLLVLNDLVSGTHKIEVKYRSGVNGAFASTMRYSEYGLVYFEI